MSINKDIEEINKLIKWLYNLIKRLIVANSIKDNSLRLKAYDELISEYRKEIENNVLSN